MCFRKKKILNFVKMLKMKYLLFWKGTQYLACPIFDHSCYLSNQLYSLVKGCVRKIFVVPCNPQVPVIRQNKLSCSVYTTSFNDSWLCQNWSIFLIIWSYCLLQLKKSKGLPQKQMSLKNTSMVFWKALLAVNLSNQFLYINLSTAR